MRSGPLRSFAARLYRRNCLERLPLLGFPSPVAPSAWEVYFRAEALSAEFYLLRSVPPSGFLNLLTACSSQCLVALFHATGTRWVLPSELCSWPGAVPPLDGRCPHVVLRPAPRCLKKYRDAEREPPSGLCSPGKSGARRSLVRLTAARGSPGISPL